MIENSLSLEANTQLIIESIRPSFHRSREASAFQFHPNKTVKHSLAVSRLSTGWFEKQIKCLRSSNNVSDCIKLLYANFIIELFKKCVNAFAVSNSSVVDIFYGEREAELWVRHKINFISNATCQPAGCVLISCVYLVCSWPLRLGFYRFSWLIIYDN